VNPALALLDDWPADAARQPDWRAAVERSLRRDRPKWIAGADELTRDRSWVLLGWSETAASLVVAGRRGRASRVRAIAFAFAVLAASPLDRRDIQVVAALVRRACVLAGLDFHRLARRGCRHAGALGDGTWAWLRNAPASTPATHRETGTGSSFLFERVSGRPEPVAEPVADVAPAGPVHPPRWGGVGAVGVAKVVGVVAVATLLIAGIVVLYERGVVPLAGPFVAAVLGPTVVLLAAWARRGRALRAARALGEDLLDVERLLERERATPAPDRPSTASYHELEQCSSEVDTALQLLTSQRDDEAAAVVIELATRIDETWPADAPLTTALRTAARRAHTLATKSTGR
jgi:hypothetical protein